ncbi:uncharacterized protein LOC115624045 [Scaptodrosophila lebanonensis]|uniref:Uncharacterized protein LOC115624045 n=1 Tax=Drosophila lebanonensis TaxID=7225 RepID=A0A6J2TGB9_DROLE|nr:uncharacterized protein LOC115624045 [Scaptodrosophila lebanonensis]
MRSTVIFQPQILVTHILRSLLKMSEIEEENNQYLMDTGVLPRLLEILEQMADIEPPPDDPLMHILHALGCPVIPQSQMKALERKVSRAHDELRNLRRLLIDLGGEEFLYDSDSDEEQYVGSVTALGLPQITTHPNSPPAGLRRRTSSFATEDSSPTLSPSSSPPPPPLPPQYYVDAAIVAVEQPAVLQETEPPAVDDDEKPCCSRSVCKNLS